MRGRIRRPNGIRREMSLRVNKTVGASAVSAPNGMVHAPLVPAVRHDVVAAAEQRDQVGPQGGRDRDLFGDDLVQPTPPDTQVGVPQAGVVPREAGGDEVGPSPEDTRLGPAGQIRVVKALGAAVAEGDEALVAHSDPGSLEFNV
jgi:hypothetical protein